MKRLIATLLAFQLAWGAGPALAQGISLIRDAEIEATVRAYSAPLLQASGMSPSAVKIHLVNDPSLNAFVIPGNRMFIHTGLLMRSERPDQVMGVMAHEIGHIAGGHYIGRKEKIDDATMTLLASFLFGVGLAILAQDGRAAAAGSIIGQEIAVRDLLSYTQSQERAADQHAVTLLDATGQSPEGLAEFFEILSDQEALLSTNQDPYLRTHPLTRERVEYLRAAVARSPYEGRRLDEELVNRHQRMRAKLIGFLQPVHQVRNSYPEEGESLYSRYAWAIAYYRDGALERSLTLLDALLADYPDDPYFHELRGQILFENQRAAEAVVSYQRAADILPRESQILLRLAQVQLSFNDPAYAQPALDNLAIVLSEEPSSIFGWRLASTAHALLGDDARTSLALAEMKFAEGEYRSAIGQARRAQELLATGTPAHIRAGDLESAAKRAMERAQRAQ